MKITRITSHILGYDLPEPLGYSQQYYTKRTAHLVEVETDEGITGWGECFGAGNIALANKGIVEQVIQPMVLGMDPLDRDVIWHKIYNLMRDHGQKGMPLQSLSGVDIALWDIAGKVAGLPLHKMIGGAHRDRIDVYGYGMMLRPESADSLIARFGDEAAAIKGMGFIPSFFWLPSKIVFLAFFFILIRGVLPRYRYDQLMDIGWKVFIPLTLGWLCFISGTLISFDMLPNFMFIPDIK